MLVRKFGAQNFVKKTKNKKNVGPKKVLFQKKKFARKKFVPIFFDDFE